MVAEVEQVRALHLADIILPLPSRRSRRDTVDYCTAADRKKCRGGD